MRKKKQEHREIPPNPRKERKAHRHRPFRRDRERRSFLPYAIGISGGVILATAAFWYFRNQAEEVVSGSADAYDTKALEAIRARSGRGLDDAMEIATHLGSHTAVGTAAFVTAFTMMRRGRRTDAWTVLSSVGGAMLLNTALKMLFRRQRPRELSRQIKLPRSHSFPSGHSLLSAATYPIVAHHLVRSRSPVVQLTAQMLAGAVILSVGYSRVYFGVHYPSDVLGGFAAGLGWLGLTSLSHTIHLKERMRKPAATD